MFHPATTLLAATAAAMLLATGAFHGDVLPGQDNAPDFQILKYNNPGAVADLGVGLWAWPMPMDYDGDGDMDLLVSCNDKPFSGTWFFENARGEKVPVFEPPVRIGEPLRDVQVSYVAGKPRVLIPGAELRNFRAGMTPERHELLPANFVSKHFQEKPRFNQWKFVDFENDGDADIIIGVDDWFDYGWDNAYDGNGNWTNGPLHGYVYLVENENGAYIRHRRIEAGGVPIDVYGAPSPNFADFDQDGDLDIICGEFLDGFTWFENSGTREQPVYQSGRVLKNKNGAIKMELEMIIPVAVDWNGDGFIDLVVGDEDGRVALIENSGEVKAGMPVFKSPVYFKQKADNVKFGALATPFAVDWDNDGDEDIVSGNTAGFVGFIENLGMYNGMPRWSPPVLLKAAGKVIRIQAGKNGSIQGPAEAKWGYTTVSVADWDGDGRKDLMLNSIWGKVCWFKNVGSATHPKLGPAQPVKVDWGNAGIPRPAGTWWDPEPQTLAPQWRTTPLGYDWNRDGLMDLVMLDHEGYLSFFERFRKDDDLFLKPGRRVFYGVDFSGYDQRHRVQDSTAGPLQLNTGRFGGSGRRKFCIADWNGDGQVDLLVNSLNVSVLQNTGENEGRTFFRYNEPLADLVLAGHTTSPTVVDWNQDGVPDLLAGAEDGHFYYLENR